MRLVFGVLDVSYADANGSGSSTTGDVAEILEKNYHVMETFYELKKEQIASVLADSVADAIADLIAGHQTEPTFTGTQKIETMFRTFLDANEMAALASKYGMTLSAAAVAGVNHRKKMPYSSKNKARPAFVDTGLYRTSFRAWMEKN